MRRRRTEPVLITDAAESPAQELRRREIRYVVMMSIRALCLILAAVLVSIRPPLLGVWLALCVTGMVLIPWLAVILANDRPPRRRGERQRSGAAATRVALPPPRDRGVIDADDHPGPAPAGPEEGA